VLLILKINFYTKNNCPLCDKAEGTLEPFVRKYNIIVHKINISDDQDAYQKYRHMVPVIEFPDDTVLWGRIDGDDIKNALSRS
jgi:thiol-disulfide isomerase/thioredoxin